jgi:hypothetical protein
MSSKVQNTSLASKIGKRVEPVHMKHYSNEQASIIRQSSIKSAVELVGQWYAKEEKIELKKITELTLLVAEKFEEWVKR